MTNNQQTAWIDALRYLTNADDAPDKARHDCRLALLALDASNELRNREHLSSTQPNGHQPNTTTQLGADAPKLRTNARERSAIPLARVEDAPDGG